MVRDPKDEIGYYFHSTKSSLTSIGGYAKLLQNSLLKEHENTKHLEWLESLISECDNLRNTIEKIESIVKTS